MPEIDVDDVILDGFIAGEAFWVYRRLQGPLDHGRTQIVGAWSPANGAVYPSGDNSLVRQEAFEQQNNAITVVTPFRLRGVSKTSKGDDYQPDLVYWDGDFYIVSDLKDWSRYGEGFMEAACTSYQFVDKPAPEPPSTVQGAADFSKPVNSGLVPVVGGK